MRHQSKLKQLIHKGRGISGDDARLGSRLLHQVGDDLVKRAGAVDQSPDLVGGSFEDVRNLLLDDAGEVEDGGIRLV